MRSEMMLANYEVPEATWRDAVGGNPHFVAISESPRFVGRAVAALAADSPGPPSQRRLVILRRPRPRVRLHRSDGSQPDCWRYMVEVQDAGRPADPTGYR